MTGGLLAVGASYLIGGIPFGWILYRAAAGSDIRGVGSGNIGATNVARAGGWGIGVLTLILDAAKGAVAVLIGLAATGEPAWAGAAAMAAVAGHCFPAALRFRGGKGVATGCGAFLFLDPLAMAAAVGAFAGVVAATRMVSAGSIAGAAVFPLAAWILGEGGAMPLWAALAGALIVLRHRENIDRILRGEERRIGARRKEEA